MKLTPEKLSAFCAALAMTGIVKRACEAVEVSRQTAYGWRDDHPDFAEAWDRALRIGIGELEDEAHRRAFEGTDKPLVHQGQFTAVYERDSKGKIIYDDEVVEIEEKGEKKNIINKVARIQLDANGQPRIATMKEYSDTLAIFLLKAHDPEKYRERSSVDVGNTDNKPFQIEDSVRADKLGGLLKAVALRVGVEHSDLL